MKRLFGIFFIFLILCGCSHKIKVNSATSSLDNPKYYFVKGMSLIEQGNYKIAEKSFLRAIKLDKKYFGGYCGLGLLYSYTSTANFNIIDGNFNKAFKYSKNDNEKFIIYINKIRALTNLYKDKKNLEKINELYSKALNLSLSKNLLFYEKNSLSYFMGQAYFRYKNLKKAKNFFTKVLKSKNKKLILLAINFINRINRIEIIQSSFPGDTTYKELTYKDKITREEISAVISKEFNLNKKSIKFIPIDIKNNPFKNEILTIISQHIRGLEPIWKKIHKTYLFLPKLPVKRKDFALILEDLLMILTKNKNLSTQFYGAKSPFKDINKYSPYFNAAMTCSINGLISKSTDSYFYPEKYITGDELLMAIIKLKILTK